MRGTRSARLPAYSRASTCRCPAARLARGTPPRFTILRRGGPALQGRGQRRLLSFGGTLLVGLGTPVRRRETVRPSVPSHPTWVAFRQETICCRGPRARAMLLARKGIPARRATGHLSAGPVAAASSAQDVSVGEAKAAPPGG